MCKLISSLFLFLLNGEYCNLWHSPLFLLNFLFLNFPCINFDRSLLRIHFYVLGLLHFPLTAFGSLFELGVRRGVRKFYEKLFVDWIETLNRLGFIWRPLDNVCDFFFQFSVE